MLLLPLYEIRILISSMVMSSLKRILANTNDVVTQNVLQRLKLSHENEKKETLQQKGDRCRRGNLHFFIIPYERMIWQGVRSLRQKTFRKDRNSLFGFRCMENATS